MDKIIKLKEKVLFIGIISMVLFSISCIYFKEVVYSASDEKKVLYISSYSPDFITVPDQIKGIEEVFQGNNINLDIEFMDMKRFDNEENLSIFHKLIQYKLANLEKYDGIIVADDHALQFAMDYHEELFPQIPIVFLGVNDFERAKLSNQNPYFTGIIEETSIEDNIEIAMRFNRKATKAVVIVDNTLTGRGDKTQFYSIEDKFPQLEFSDINSEEYTFQEVGRILEEIRNDSIVIYTNMFLDKTGAYLSMEDSFQFMKEHSVVPIYRASVGGVGQGLFGGKMVSYYESGKIAAGMVLEIFHGTPVESIEMIMESPNKYVFDYELIKKYHIDEDLIPKDAILINRKVSFVEQYKELVTITLLILLFLILLSVTLIVSNIRRKIIQKALKESYGQLELTYEELTASEEELRLQYEKIEEHMEQIELLNEKYEHLAHYDYLTNLPNRFKFMIQLEEVMKDNRSGAILLIDIDNFKEVNDTLGHMYGDELLKQFATRLSQINDNKLLASRFGGDEFMVLISDIEEIDKINEYVLRIKEVLLEAFVIENRENNIEFSMGITRFPLDSNNANQLLMNADTALYQVKQMGKNSCMFYENQMQTQLKDKTEIEAILRHAIKHEGFKLVYQPQVSVENGEIISFEALLRLKDHKISPAKFIGIAEETGLIIKIGRWVTKEVIEQLAKWKANGIELKPVAINFSSKQIRDKNYFQFLKDILKDNEIEAKYIEIEITEGILLENTEETMEFLNKLKEYGIKIALDDFGTGYSSLNYLSFIPVNKVKLDKSLSDKFLDKNNAMVISSIISLAHSLKLDITAEGIEEFDQYKLLKTEGCDFIQGYLFSMPLSVEEVEKVYGINLLDRISK